MDIPKGKWGKKGGWFILSGEIWFSCPSCGSSGKLEENHLISSEGIVAPSIDCPCGGFHEIIKLKDFNN